MNIEQITRCVSDYEARENIHRQYQSDLQVFGERKALEFARFRADALAIEQITRRVSDQEARDHIRRQYQSDIRIFGERKAIEFARFRADAAANMSAAASARKRANSKASSSPNTFSSFWYWRRIWSRASWSLTVSVIWSMVILVPFCVEGYGGAAQFTTAGEGQQGAAYGYFARAGDVFQVGDAAGDFIGKLYDALHQGFEFHIGFLLVCCFDVLNYTP